ncbi:NTP transferase domain-containing protein [Halorubrum ezzemoulense]|uniref:NTP transferase domain-containing protein n=1 Tax=Halorubrum ezzemoulense TaxID=337243 RepID=A0ABT4Z5F7_HALEZ|nr:NTP transferase domain-containing protein [Halorubrum ezzemoulense]MDB2245101.1 NTP transferase domain-containing protein [Halorubrum ezzemoulense]MDB2252587.1 NTP transferase domain-containing protein [Halorubrum ezzemoulense]MDB2278141.1 NTP transferase domain-containing protein [Halorubrum ezzemoulense]MDB2284815.1 NTP transferase domain-containing protein [Halorubrum ezzemoulense]MDB2288437.1 NTP transferase domain-containing protein [Halorubrum ezzemoulense]
MCGGRGTRLDREGEKPLAPVAGRSMVDRTLDALAASRVETAYAAVSPHTPRTRERLGERASGGRRVADGAERGAGSVEVTVVDTPGDGYVADLQAALAEGPEPPVLTVAVDLPLLDGPAVDAVLDAHAAAGSDSLSVRVPAARKRGLGASADAATRYDGAGGECGGGDEAADGDAPDERVPAGVNVVGALDGGGGEAVRATRDARLALNVNRPGDRRLAKRILAGDRDAPTLPSGGVDWLGKPEPAEGGDRP